MRVSVCLAVVAFAAGLAGESRPFQAQSLGDLARTEQERRKDIKAPAKVITNKDLSAVPGPPPGSASSAASPDAAQDAPRAQDDKDKSQGKDKDKGAPQKDQAYWVGRKKSLQDQLAQDQTLADAMQSRINALTADFSARADPVQRSGIDRDRQRALAELDRLRKSLVEGRKALADVDEEARKAGVPPGWLR